MEDDGQLLRRRPLLAPVREPHLEGGQLILEEAAGDIGLVLLEDALELGQTEVQCEVPGLPHGVTVCVGQRGLTEWGAVVGLHDALSEQEVAEQRGHQEVLSEQLLEGVPGQRVPGDRVCDRSEDPIKLAQHGPSVPKLTGNLLKLIKVDPGSDVASIGASHDEPPERHLDGGGEAGGEEVCRQLRRHGQQLVLGTGGQLDAGAQ